MTNKTHLIHKKHINNFAADSREDLQERSQRASGEHLPSFSVSGKVRSSQGLSIVLFIGTGAAPRASIGVGFRGAASGSGVGAAGSRPGGRLARLVT